MKYAAVWKQTMPSGQTQRLIAHPETLEDIDTVQKAQNEGRVILSNLPPDKKSMMMPLSVVELNEEMISALDNAPLVEVETGEEELMFVNVDGLPYWSGHGWWNR